MQVQATFVPVRQRLPRNPVRELEPLVEAALRRGRPIAAGEHMAIAVGSRGIDRIAEVVEVTVRALRSRGALPFIVPAMGSHGGATAGGQRRLLEGLGITEASAGAPVRSTMETVLLGLGQEKVPFNRYAAAADGIVVINRVKPHSILARHQGSGLCKMVAVGLGSHAGARALHDRGLAEHLPRVWETLLEAAPLRVGIALVEDAHDQLSLVEGATPEEFARTDCRLLRRVRAALPTIPFDPLDGVLCVWMGKNISGAGMDPNVIGFHRRNGGPAARTIHRLGVLRLTEESHGNAVGVGMADVVPATLVADIEPTATLTNAETSGWTEGARVHRVLPREIDVAREVCRGAPDSVRVVVVPDTAHLDRMLVTPALLDEVEKNENLTIAGPPRTLEFDGEGRFVDNF